MRMAGWLPLLVGTIAILALAVHLTVRHSAPGELSATHNGIPNLSLIANCRRCHAMEGLAHGCLGCHREIAVQLDERRGYHHRMLADREKSCLPCHTEHVASNHALTGPAAWGSEGRSAFRHEHVEYRLVARHDQLECEKCHTEKLRAPFRLAEFPALARAKTHLGLDQRCITCHEDPHAGGLSSDCASCHDQQAFRPAPNFDHDCFFTLGGAHASVDCEGCHPIPRAESGKQVLPFTEVRGKTCADCHATPHRTDWKEPCESCHPTSAPQWKDASTKLTSAAHALSGFHLETPHSKVACTKCHPSAPTYAARFPDTRAAGYRRSQESCEGCHRDEHGGQFAGLADRCVHCHETEHFLPSRLTVPSHRSWPLLGAHPGVECNVCHRVDPAIHVRVYVTTDRTCKACHNDPHDGQFQKELAKGDCTACHKDDATTFAIRPFDHASATGWPLTGAHARAACADCHRENPPSVANAANGASAGRLASVRQYRGASRECSSCHVDYHRGQFRRDGRTSCETCHPSTDTWKESSFDHDRDSRFPLERAHRKVPCAACHPNVKSPDGSSVVQYRPIPRECQDCHGFFQD